MAEGIMRHRLPDEWRENVRVESAGTLGFDGCPPSELACRVCAENGIDITGHRSRRLTEKIVADSDIILTMERQHLAYVEALGGAGKASMITEYRLPSGRGGEIEDPIGRDLETYGDVFRRLEGEIDRVVRHLTRAGGDRRR